MKTVRVLQCGALTDTYGGIEAYIYNQWKCIDKDKIAYEFLVSRFDDCVAYEKELQSAGVKIHRDWVGRTNGIFSHYKALYNFFKNHEYDAVVCNVLRLSNIDCLLFAFFFHIPIRIVHSHQAFDGVKHGCKYKLMEKLHLHLLPIFCTHLLGCSNEAGRWMFGGLWNKYLGNRAFVIKNGIDSKRFAYSETIRNDKRTVLGVNGKIVFGHTGRLSPQKNQLFVLDVFYEIHKYCNNSHLLLVGDGVLRKKIEDKIKKMELEDNVTLLGERLDIPEILQAMDVFLFPSEWEGLGISLIEAQASGLRCFVSDVIPQEAIVTDNVIKLPLSKGSFVWAKTIMQSMNYERVDRSADVRTAGFDSVESCRGIEKIFINAKSKADGL